MSTVDFDAALHAYNHDDLATAKQRALMVIAAQPDHVPAHQLLGAIALHSHSTADAVRHFERAAALAPNDFETAYNLGVVFHQTRKLPHARRCYEQALHLAPNYVPALENLALVHRAMNQLDEARTLLLRALDIDPSRATLYWHLTGVARQSEQFGAALAYGQRAVALAPQQQTWCLALANDLFAAGDFAGVREQCEHVMSFIPGHAEAKTLLGCCAMAENNYAEADALFSDAIQSAPDDLYAHLNRGFLRLKLGDYVRGWDEFDWRVRHPDFLEGVNAPPENIPLWRGEPLAGKRLLVMTEQGLGDTVMFVRFLARLQAQGAHIVLQCQSGMKLLLQRVAGIEVLIDETEALPPSIDYYIWLLSVPHRLAFDPQSEPLERAYLSPDPARAARWGEWLGDTPGHRIGVVVTGNVQHRGNLHRSVPAHCLYPLVAVPDTQFLVLQKNGEDVASQALRTQLAATPMPADWDKDGRFVDTAALLTQLDVLVTVDTAIAHVAGALNVPTLLLLSARCDWRWGAQGDRTPWYPSVTLVRQTGADWSTAINRVFDLLQTRQYASDR